jgi:hypothetical protein
MRGTSTRVNAVGKGAHDKYLSHSLISVCFVEEWLVSRGDCRACGQLLEGEQEPLRVLLSGVACRTV